MFGLLGNRSAESTYPVENLCIRPSDLALPESTALGTISKRVLNLIDDHDTTLRVRQSEIDPEYLGQYRGDAHAAHEEAFSLVLERSISDMTDKERTILFDISLILNHFINHQEYRDGQLFIYKNVVQAFIWGDGRCNILNPEGVPKRQNIQSEQELKSLILTGASSGVADNYQNFLDHWQEINQSAIHQPDTEDLYLQWMDARKSRPWLLK